MTKKTRADKTLRSKSQKFLCLFVFIITYSSPLLSHAAPNPQSTQALDFAMACEVSKIAQRTKQDPALKGREDEVRLRMSRMALAGLRSADALTAYKDAKDAKAEDRKKIWHEAAKETGLSNWSCPSIGNL
ncbi:MAG: hypothetical protein KF681_08255 [Bdellovibrionaceae bacterium]|nr:hypothetical protein [Pseudobdellovibrionaceae bacterium]